jgi:hypothetical protein
MLKQVYPGIYIESKIVRINWQVLRAVQRRLHSKSRQNFTVRSNLESKHLNVCCVVAGDPFAISGNRGAQLFNLAVN